MSEANRMAKDSLKRDLCFVCGKYVPDGSATYWSEFRIRVCTRSACDELVESLTRDYSNSNRGKWRTRADVLRLIMEHKRR